MEELIVNFHNHSLFSDGTASVEKIASTALKAKLDAVILTDHNIMIQGFDHYFQDGEKKVLVLIGEEIHDQNRQPQKSHLLVFGSNQELAHLAGSPQRLIDQVNQLNGVTFLAHPHESDLPFFDEKAITWEDWEVKGYTGIEIWNALSELKTVAHNKLEGLFYILFPAFLAHAPNTQTLKKWDELLSQGKKIVAVGGVDAHGLSVRVGPFKRTVYDYAFHYQTINNHLLVPEKLTGQVREDKQIICDAFQSGHCFVGYDLPHPTTGFRFSAQGKDDQVIMGDEIKLNRSVTLQVRLPAAAECRLLRNGQIAKIWKDNQFYTYIAFEPGAYRVECYIHFLGKRRGWIFSNPIYIRSPKMHRS